MSSSRPEWMEGGVKRPKQPPRHLVPESPQARVVIHRNVVIGVTLLALVTLFSLFFWLTIVILRLVNTPDPFVGDLTWGRVLIATFVGALLAALTWSVADNAIDA